MFPKFLQIFSQKPFYILESRGRFLWSFLLVNTNVFSRAEIMQIGQNSKYIDDNFDNMNNFYLLFVVG